MNSNLVAENKMIRGKITELEDEIFDLKEAHMKKNLKQTMAMSMEQKQIRVMNKNLKDRFDFLKNREVELVSMINKKEAKETGSLAKGK